MIPTTLREAASPHPPHPQPLPTLILGEGSAGVGRKPEGLSKSLFPLHARQGLYQFSVVETAEPGTLVGRLQAQDPDLGDNALMAYSILDGEGSEAFSISTDSQGRDGLLTVRKVSLLQPPADGVGVKLSGRALALTECTSLS